MQKPDALQIYQRAYSEFLKSNKELGQTTRDKIMPKTNNLKMLHKIQH